MFLKMKPIEISIGVKFHFIYVVVLYPGYRRPSVMTLKI
jgi:hypothetical protein